jgi:hypothetical protein
MDKETSRSTREAIANARTVAVVSQTYLRRRRRTFSMPREYTLANRRNSITAGVSLATKAGGAGYAG